MIKTERRKYVLPCKFWFLVWLTMGGSAVEPPGQEREENLRLAEDGSEIANITNFPYTAALQMRKGGEFQLICTASILHKTWVLTAAHCVVFPKKYQVKAGADKLADMDNAAITQTRPARAIQSHPRYWATKVSKFDVALIKVDEFVFNDRVNKIAPYAMDWTRSNEQAQNKDYYTETCVAVGWGKLEITDKETSDNLRYANMTVRHGRRACACFPMYAQRRLICNDPKEPGGVCPGDSGGPLVCNGSVAGVAHVIYNRDSCKWDNFGKLELSCSGPSVVGAWMYVCPMLDFIGEYVPDTPSKPPSCRSPQKIGLSTVVAALPTTLSYWLTIVNQQ